MIDVQTIARTSLGDRSYLAHDGRVAVVVDPQRDIDRVLALADELGVRITHVAEIHIHNDYVTGGLELAEFTGAAYLIDARERVAFDHTPITEGEDIAVGSMRLRPLATPGHTHHDLSYALTGTQASGSGAVTAVFTGGSMLYGDHPAQAAEQLGATGLDAVSVAGGTSAWAPSGRPTLSDQRPPVQPRLEKEELS